MRQASEAILLYDNWNMREPDIGLKSVRTADKSRDHARTAQAHPLYTFTLSHGFRMGHSPHAKKVLVGSNEVKNAYKHKIIIQVFIFYYKTLIIPSAKLHTSS